MVSTEILERNTAVIRKELEFQTNDSLDVGNRIIDEEMTGVEILLKPIVKAFYSIIRKDLAKNTLKQVNGTIKIARDMIENNYTPESPEFNQYLESKFPVYLKYDSTGNQCKNSHRNFSKLVENLKHTFEWQVRPLMILLKVDAPDIKVYNDLVHYAFPNAEECKAVLEKQLTHMRIGLQVIEQDLTILDIPVAREFVFNVLKKGFKFKTDQFMKNIDDIYGNPK